MDARAFASPKRLRPRRRVKPAHDAALFMGPGSAQRHEECRKPRPEHYSLLDATGFQPYSRAHVQDRDHHDRPPPPHLCGMGGRSRLVVALPPDPVRGNLSKPSAI
jgi:hypothetical protein